MSVFTEYKKEIMDAVHNKRIRLALTRAIATYRVDTDNALSKFPHTIKMAEEVREIKVGAISEMEKLTQQACEAIESNKGKAYIAKTADEALKIIGELVGSNKLIVKGKSLTGEEIELREYLEEHGNEVFETDLGEFILQKLGAKPMHIVAPSIHIPKEDVAQLFSRITGEELPPDNKKTTERKILPGRYRHERC
jgi:L-lactate dehydrogenase complex protein LldG